ncbi:unnamed protein product [Lampetra fluviatilis]
MGIGGVVVRALRYQLGDLSLSPRPTPCLACRVNISAEVSKAAGCVVGRIAHLARHANSSQQPAWFCTVFVWRALEAVWTGSAVGSGARPRCPLTNVCITLTLACGRAAPCHASAFPPVTNPYGRTVPPAVAAAARLGSAGVQAASLGCPREAGRPAFYSEKGTQRASPDARGCERAQVEQLVVAFGGLFSSLPLLLGPPASLGRFRRSAEEQQIHQAVPASCGVGGRLGRDLWDIVESLPDQTKIFSIGDSEGEWTVNEKDMEASLENKRGPSFHSTRIRYYDKTVTCRNCDKQGHLSKNCPSARKLPTCGVCGTKGHVANVCPFRLCPNCHRPGHVLSDCMEKPGHYKQCHRCCMTGHYADECPDTWRQFHLTELLKAERNEGGAACARHTGILQPPAQSHTRSRRAVHVPASVRVCTGGGGVALLPKAAGVHRHGRTSTSLAAAAAAATSEGVFFLSALRRASVPPSMMAKRQSESLSPHPRSRSNERDAAGPVHAIGAPSGEGTLSVAYFSVSPGRSTLCSDKTADGPGPGAAPPWPWRPPPPLAAFAPRGRGLSVRAPLCTEPGGGG